MEADIKRLTDLEEKQRWPGINRFEEIEMYRLRQQFTGCTNMIHHSLTAPKKRHWIWRMIDGTLWGKNGN